MDGGVSVPAPDEVRAVAAEIVARDDYHLTAHEPPRAWLWEWVLWLLDWLVAPFRWVYEHSAGLPEALRWIIVLVLVLVVVGLTFHILYSLIRALSPGMKLKRLEADEGPQRPDAAEFERLADGAAGAGDFITAVRHLFRACVLRLEKREDKRFRPGTTNRELLRRYRREPAVAEPLGLFVDCIERKWYGDEFCSDADYALCRAAHHDVFRFAKGKPHVHGA